MVRPTSYHVTSAIDLYYLENSLSAKIIRTSIEKKHRYFWDKRAVVKILEIQN